MTESGRLENLRVPLLCPAVHKPQFMIRGKHSGECDVLANILTYPKALMLNRSASAMLSFASHVATSLILPLWRNAVVCVGAVYPLLWP